MRLDDVDKERRRGLRNLWRTRRRRMRKAVTGVAARTVAGAAQTCKRADFA